MSAKPHVVDGDGTLAIIAALVAGDRWLSADACAALFGLYELAVYVIHHLAWVKP